MLFFLFLTQLQTCEWKGWNAGPTAQIQIPKVNARSKRDRLDPNCDTREHSPRWAHSKLGTKHGHTTNTLEEKLVSRDYRGDYVHIHLAMKMSETNDTHTSANWKNQENWMKMYNEHGGTNASCDKQAGSFVKWFKTGAKHLWRKPKATSKWFNHF